MADTYETKKINELSEATSAENSDLMMVGNPTSGQTSKITKENLMKDITTSLTQATNDIAENKIAIEQNASDITEINSALTEKNIVAGQFICSDFTGGNNAETTAQAVIWAFNNLLSTGQAINAEIIVTSSSSGSDLGFTVIGVKSENTRGRFFAMSRTTNSYDMTVRMTGSNGCNYYLLTESSETAVTLSSISPSGTDDPDNPMVDDPEGTPTPED